MTTSYAPVPPPPPAPPTRRTADIALLLGVLSLPFSFLAGVPAVFFGIRALRVADQVGGRGRAWVGIVLGSVMTVAALVVLGLLTVRIVDGVRDLSAPPGSARERERDEARAKVDDAALVRVTGVPLDQLQATAGVVLTHDPGATVDCFDSCSQAELQVAAGAARRGPLARTALLARLRTEGYLGLDGTVGCPAVDPTATCYLRAPDNRASVVLSTGPDGAYALRVNGTGR